MHDAESSLVRVRMCSQPAAPLRQNHPPSRSKPKLRGAYTDHGNTPYGTVKVPESPRASQAG